MSKKRTILDLTDESKEPEVTVKLPKCTYKEVMGMFLTEMQHEEIVKDMLFHICDNFDGDLRDNYEMPEGDEYRQMYTLATQPLARMIAKFAKRLLEKAENADADNWFHIN